jgi:hypothetical protein
MIMATAHVRNNMAIVCQHAIRNSCVYVDFGVSVRSLGRVLPLRQSARFYEWVGARRTFPGRHRPIALRFHAPRKPGAAVTGHPPNACVGPLGPAGKTFCTFAILLRAESPVVCRRGKPRPSHATDPVFHAAPNIFPSRPPEIPRRLIRLPADLSDRTGRDAAAVVCFSWPPGCPLNMSAFSIQKRPLSAIDVQILALVCMVFLRTPMNSLAGDRRKIIFEHRLLKHWTRTTDVDRRTKGELLDALGNNKPIRAYAECHDWHWDLNESERHALAATVRI